LKSKFMKISSIILNLFNFVQSSFFLINLKIFFFFYLYVPTMFGSFLPPCAELLPEGTEEEEEQRTGKLLDSPLC
jgi:hypothetical protein